jgi:hypothetical protein
LQKENKNEAEDAARDAALAPSIIDDLWFAPAVDPAGGVA